MCVCESGVGALTAGGAGGGALALRRVSGGAARAARRARDRLLVEAEFALHTRRSRQEVPLVANYNRVDKATELFSVFVKAEPYIDPTTCPSILNCCMIILSEHAKQGDAWSLR